MYNAESTILSLLESINDAMYLPYEIICVNDGSTDGTKDIVVNYIYNNSHAILVNQINSGPSVARNRGIRTASGKWILFCDADDYYLVDGLKKLQEDVMSNSSVGLFVFNYIMNDNSRRHNEAKAVVSTREFLGSAYDNGDYLYIHALWNKVYKKDIFELSGLLDEDYSLGEDALFNIRYLSSISKVAVYDIPLYKYNVWRGSLSHGGKTLDSLWGSYLTIYSAILSLFQSNEIQELDKKVFRRYFFGSINEYLKSGIKTKSDDRILVMMLSNYSWISRLNLKGCPNKFEIVLIYVSRHFGGHMALALCKLKRYRLGIKSLLDKLLRNSK